MKSVLAGLLFATSLGTAGCGSDAPSEITITGTVHVASRTLAKPTLDAEHHPTGRCTVPTLEDKKVLISDANGERLALADVAFNGQSDPIDPGEFDMYSDTDPWTCSLAFEVKAPNRGGVYSAELEGMDASTSFAVDDAGAVVIEVS